MIFFLMVLKVLFHFNIESFHHLSIKSNRIANRKLSTKIHQTHTTKLFYNDVYDVQLPPNHRFPMNKYRIVREGLEQEYNLTYSNNNNNNNNNNTKNVVFEVSPLATFSELETTHCPYYIDRYISNKLTESENRKIGFPWSTSQVQRTLSSVGGTIAATRHVLDTNNIASCHIAGGTHHAFYDYGEGFCIFSDIAVAANIALKEYADTVKRILIIDLDVHQGNGNAVLFQKNPKVYTFSMHCKSNYFSQKQCSDCDIEVNENATDIEYLQQLQSILPHIISQSNPDLVFYQAGVDINKYDKLGKLKVTRHGISQRNHIVYNAILNRNLEKLQNSDFSSGDSAVMKMTKLVVTMGGGYPADTVIESQSFQEIIESHKDVYRDCISILN